MDKKPREEILPQETSIQVFLIPFPSPPFHTLYVFYAISYANDAHIT